MRFHVLVSFSPRIAPDSQSNSPLHSLGGGFFVLLYYLPIYFQSVQDVTAAQSGIRNLPLILAMSKFEPYWQYKRS